MDGDIYCPLLNKNIDVNLCFDVAMVAEGVSPKSELPAEITEIDNEVCLNCKNHQN